jgi:hypothetical protein
MPRLKRAAVADTATAAAPPTETPGPDELEPGATPDVEPGDTPPDDGLEGDTPDAAADDTETGDTPPDDALEATDTPAEADTVTVIMRSRIGGTRNGEEWPPAGGTKTLPAAEAAALCAAGWARPA